jgi:hypothetical protein
LILPGVRGHACCIGWIDLAGRPASGRWPTLKPRRPCSSVYGRRGSPLHDLKVCIAQPQGLFWLDLHLW